MLGIRTVEGAKYTFWQTIGSVNLLNTEALHLNPPPKARPLYLHPAQSIYLVIFLKSN